MNFNILRQIICHEDMLYIIKLVYEHALSQFSLHLVLALRMAHVIVECNIQLLICTSLHKLPRTAIIGHYDF